MKLKLLPLLVIAVTIFTVITEVQAQQLPYLRKQGNATQLIVDGKPFLVLAGELGNSSSSSAEYMRPIWPKLAALNLNTVLMPVYWELVEPSEGEFDFSLVDHTYPRCTQTKPPPRTALVCLLEEQHVVLCAGMGKN